MKKEQQRNDSIKTKLDKIMYSMDNFKVQDDRSIEDKASKVKDKDHPNTSERQMQDPFVDAKSAPHAKHTASRTS
jgi:hypothetical protein